MEIIIKFGAAKVEQMKRYDFDQVIDRKCSGSVKVDGLKKIFGNESLTPMWVADMDFETPDFVVNALKQRLEHPVFGYTMEPDDFRPAIKDWVSTHHGWEIESDWITYIPGIVKGIGMVINALLDKGDKIIIQPPVYHPFRLVSQKNGHEVVYNPMKELPGGGYEMDFENLEQVCDDRCKLLILANPHNPAGIVWSRETLVKLAEFCHRKGLVVISDEIHCDMALYGNKHIPFATVSEAAANCSITFGAPSKTFNIAGIVSSFAIVPNKELRESLFAWLKANEFEMATIFAMVATEAAFTKGDNWRKQMISYIEQNIDFVDSYLKENIPQVKLTKPQASYLVWLDFSALGMEHKKLVEWLINDAHLAMNDGAMFGQEGEQHMRMNVGTQRATLLEALENLKNAVNNLEQK